MRQILQKHFGKLRNVDVNLERALMGKDNNDKLAWQAIPCPDLKLPKRYEGGLLFGQLVPRFDNRIISTCPISGQKVPSRNCPEFLNFRWAMQLANIRIGKKSDRELRPLKGAECVALNKQMRERGYLTPKELKDAVRSVTACERDNLDTMLMHPDAKEALLVDPVQKLISSDDLQPFWKLLPERLQKRLRGQWRRGKVFSLTQIRKQLESLGDATAFDAELQMQLDTQNTKAKKKDKQVTREELLQKHFPSRPLKQDGRAAFARHLLKQAYEDVLVGKPHPKEEGGCLFITEGIREAQINRAIAEQTNNHLVRHRLVILERLLNDIIKEYAGGKKERIGKITIEVNRDLREMSGKTAKEKAQDLGLKIADHHRVVAKLEAAFAGQTYNGKPIQISAGLIRKARIAEDLGWVCPYTGKEFEPIDLVSKRVDKDHVIPRVLRPSDSLESLVMTFSQVNAMKKKRTAWQFMKEDQAKEVDGLPGHQLKSLKWFESFVDSLPPKSDPAKRKRAEGHRRPIDDDLRKWKRKRLLLLPDYEEKEFVPGDLTQTSQLVRLGAQVLKRAFANCEKVPTVVSLPGSVTGTVRKGWKLEGCLSLANSQVLDEDGKAKTKKEIRDITHLHHALDACVLGIAAIRFPNQNLGGASLWELLVKRKYNEQEKAVLRALGLFQFDSTGNGQLTELSDNLKEQIRHRLAEKRVVQHIPARMDGLRVEQNTWRVVAVKKDEVVLRQRIRQPDGTRSDKTTEEKPSKLLGLNPTNGNGKLAKNKGALVIPDNFGVALDPQPTVIPFHKVWTRLGELKKANGNKMPRVLRNGQLIRVPRGSRAGIWKVMSTKDTEAYGLALDLALPDRVKLDRGNAPIEALIQDGLEILDCSFVGIDSTGITIAEAKKRPRKPKKSRTDESCPTTSSA